MQDESPAASARPTILCIDDDRLVLGVCTDALEAHGYRVVLATHGLAGIAIASKERPALILLDILMPRMDGYEVCRRLRANRVLQHIPIILLTAVNDPELEAKGAEAGATLSLRKPFDPEQVVRAVEQVLGRKASPEVPEERN